MLLLQNDAASLVVTPEYGGAILGWMAGSMPVLRRPVPDAILRGDVRGFAGFPLVPFCNRIAFGRFAWQGRSYQLDRNFGDHAHTIHGVGWQRAWTIEAVSRTSAVLSLHHDAAGNGARAWPFPFDAQLQFSLDATRLRIGIRVTNRHDGAAPAGIGLHPYFGRSAGAVLQFHSNGVWFNGADSLPARHAAVPREWDHANGQAIGAAPLDNCFTGWNRAAHIAGIADGVTLTADAAFRHLQVYTPPRHDLFCVEPVSHVPDAINRADLPPDQRMHVLQPGESLSGMATIAAATDG